MQKTASHDYSVDMIKRTVFLDELNNALRLKPSSDKDEKVVCIIEYLEKRINEIDKKYKR